MHGIFEAIFRPGFVKIRPNSHVTILWLLLLIMPCQDKKSHSNLLVQTNVNRP